MGMETKTCDCKILTPSFMTKAYRAGWYMKELGYWDEKEWEIFRNNLVTVAESCGLRVANEKLQCPERFRKE